MSNLPLNYNIPKTLTLTYKGGQANQLFAHLDLQVVEVDFELWEEGK